MVGLPGSVNRERVIGGRVLSNRRRVARLDPQPVLRQGKAWRRSSQDDELVLERVTESNNALTVGSGTRYSAERSVRRLVEERLRA
jgi:hypothetical protein